MKTTYRILSLVIGLIVAAVFLIVPYGEGTNFQDQLIEVIGPTEANFYLDPVMFFCYFIPLIILIEGFLFRTPFTRAARVLFFLQAVGALITWPIVMLGLMHIFDKNFTNTNFTFVIVIWTTCSLLWSWALVLPVLRAKKCVNWPFYSP